MSLAHAIAPHLPYLRRYARALTGNQTVGDGFVRICLEAIVEDPDIIDRELPPRVALYMAFHRIWQDRRDKSPPRPQDGPTREGYRGVISRKLSALAPASREALLLTSMEGFSDNEAADILGLPLLGLRELVRQAMKEMTEHAPTSVLIMEDEPIISLDLSLIVEEMGHHVQGIVVTREDALRAVRASWPGLVLADIQLADGSSGIDAVSEMLRERRLPVIFITAYPERLLTGERPEPTFLVTKPFTPDAVKAAISQALFLATAEADAA